MICPMCGSVEYYQRRSTGGARQPRAEFGGLDQGARRGCGGFEQVHQPRFAEQAADKPRG